MSTLTPSQRWQILQRSNFACHYCGRKSPEYLLEADHVKPRSKGGPDHAFNRVAACQECNNGKRAEPLLAMELGGKYSFSAREAAAFMLGRNLALGVPCSQAVYRTFHGMATHEEVGVVMRAADGFSR